MTSEIAIMNRKGVALAADSVGTVTRGSNLSTGKSYDTLHKLFQLPHTRNVGIMFYGNADAMGVPMETLIRMYPGNKQLPFVADYVQDFLSYLAGFSFSEEQFTDYVHKTAKRVMLRTVTKIDREVASIIKDQGSITKLRVSKITNEHFDSSFDLIAKLVKDSHVSARARKSLTQKYQSDLEKISKALIEDRPLTKARFNKISEWLISACCINPDSFTGIVFAGFGEDEHFPSFTEIDIKGVLGKKVIYRQKSSSSITVNNDVIIRPFAEADDVITFMTGMNRDLQSFFENALSNLITDGLPKSWSQAVSESLKLSPKQTKKVEEIATTIGGAANQTWLEEFKRYQLKEYTTPVCAATRHITPDLLGAMAETLIDLVSFRHEMSMSAETVGGPIDVAVITKAEGFTWAKRKKGVGIA